MSQENHSPTAPLYTELPYPADGVVRTSNARILHTTLSRHIPEMLRRARLTIADVGCGTGETTVGICRMFPGAVVVGIDINDASLARAKSLAARENGNVSFIKADITDDLSETLQQAGAMPEEGFDLITSIGVLHHLEDPTVGFSAVRQLIRPDGLFLCYMYSRHGRREDVAAKTLLNEVLPPEATFRERAQLIRFLGLANRHNWSGFIRNLRQRLEFGPPVVPLELLRVFFKRNQLTHLSDTFSNPCEHLYSFAELKQLFETTSWSFVTLAERGGLPTSPKAHTKDPEELALLQRLPEEVLYDYFAYRYRADGFLFLLRPV